MDNRYEELNLSQRAKADIYINALASGGDGVWMDEDTVRALLGEVDIELFTNTKGGLSGSIKIHIAEVPSSEWHDCDSLEEALREGLNLRAGIRRLQESGECVDSEEHKNAKCLCFFWKVIEGFAEQTK